MPFRVTDATVNDRLVHQIAEQRQRIAVAQEQVASGKRINRPSDDPLGAAAVIEIRSSQTALNQFVRSATAANNALTTADGALDSYQHVLDSIQSRITQGNSDLLSDDGRKAIASELEGLQQTILNIANLRGNGQYVFGGTRQDVPPFDPTTAAPAATPTSPQSIQVEKDAPPVAISVTGDFIFANADGTIFAALQEAAAALRGTGDPVADKATLTASLQKFSAFTDQAAVARTTIGKGFNAVESATDRNTQQSLDAETSAQNIEGADFAKASVDLVAANQGLEAILETQAQSGRRTLLDLLG